MTMKGRFLFLGALCAAVAVGFAVLLWPDAATAAPLSALSVAAEHTWMHTALQATPALIALRAQLSDLTGQAERKLGEVSDGLAPDAIRAIERDHAALVAQADGVRAQITAEEARFTPAPVDAAAVLRAERERSAGILDLAQRAALTGNEASAAIAGNVSVDAFRAQVFDTLVARQAPGSHIRVERDETETRRLAMSESLAVRFGTPGLQPGDAARSFMDYRIVDLAAEVIGHRGRVGTTFAAQEDIIRRAMHASTDFPIIMENALNRSLAGRYTAATPTYRRLGRQRTYVDFRDHITVKAGDFPKLQEVNPEGGEIKAGTFSESKEKTAVKAYAVRVDLSRQMLVNDRIGAIAQVLADQATMVALFEDETFYGMAFGGTGANGPTLVETNRQIFNTTDGTLAAANAAISVSSISLGRAALRKRTSKDGRLLNLSASLLVVGPDKETEAQQLVAPIQAQQIGNINPFSGTLEVTTTARITGNGWHLLADPSIEPLYEWGLLEGYTAPRMRTDEPFGVQGMSVSLEHDFGCGGIGFRGGYKNIGA
jgi:hypothetical protein